MTNLTQGAVCERYPEPVPATGTRLTAAPKIAIINQLIGDKDAMNAQPLPKAQMPNNNGFITRFPGRILNDVFA